MLASNDIAAIMAAEWRDARDRHGWVIGRYVIMPDHVHFFCRAELAAKPLPIFMQKWKQWTSKRMAREIGVAGMGRRGLKGSGTVWQEEFFDHVLRSRESYAQKWQYVKENPVRAGLVKNFDDWPFQGEIESLMLIVAPRPGSPIPATTELLGCDKRWTFYLCIRTISFSFPVQLKFPKKPGQRFRVH